MAHAYRAALFGFFALLLAVLGARLALVRLKTQWDWIHRPSAPPPSLPPVAAALPASPVPAPLAFGPWSDTVLLSRFAALRGKRFLVFQADTRLHPYVSSRVVTGSFERTIAGPAAVATWQWAAQNGYGYAHLAAPPKACWNARHTQRLFLHWCKVPWIIYMYRVACALKAEAFLYMDSDAAPDVGLPLYSRVNPSLEAFVAAVEAREGVPFARSSQHLFVSPSRGFWRTDVVASRVYDTPRGYLNAGVMLVRATPQAGEILHRWWWDTMEVHSPMETVRSEFSASITATAAAAAAVARFNSTAFALRGVAVEPMSSEGGASVKVRGVYNDSDLERAHAALCGLEGARCGGIAWGNTKAGWPSDQERLQWLASVDERINMDQYRPAIGHEDAFEADKVVYHWSKNKDIKSMLARAWSAHQRTQLKRDNDTEWDARTAWAQLDRMPAFYVSANATDTLTTDETLARCFDRGVELSTHNLV